MEYSLAVQEVYDILFQGLIFLLVLSTLLLLIAGIYWLKFPRKTIGTKGSFNFPKRIRKSQSAWDYAQNRAGFIYCVVGAINAIIYICMLIIHKHMFYRFYWWVYVIVIISILVPFMAPAISCILICRKYDKDGKIKSNI